MSTVSGFKSILLFVLLAARAQADITGFTTSVGGTKDSGDPITSVQYTFSLTSDLSGTEFLIFEYTNTATGANADVFTGYASSVSGCTVGQAAANDLDSIVKYIRSDQALLMLETTALTAITAANGPITITCSGAPFNFANFGAPGLSVSVRASILGLGTPVTAHAFTVNSGSTIGAPTPSPPTAQADITDFTTSVGGTKDSGDPITSVQYIFSLTSDLSGTRFFIFEYFNTATGAYTDVFTGYASSVSGCTVGQAAANDLDSIVKYIRTDQAYLMLETTASTAITAANGPITMTCSGAPFNFASFGAPGLSVSARASILGTPMRGTPVTAHAFTVNSATIGAPNPSPPTSSPTSAPTSSPAGAPPSCFPGEARVGSEALATYEGEVGHLHAMQGFASFITLEHTYGELRASGNHLLINGNGFAVPAKDFAPGDELLLDTDMRSRVVSVCQDTTKHGMYAPLTSSGTITVDGIVASNYATIRTLNIPHSAMHASFTLSRLISLLRAKEVTGNETHNPLAYLFHRVLKLDSLL